MMRHEESIYKKIEKADVFSISGEQQNSMRDSCARSEGEHQGSLSQDSRKEYNLHGQRLTFSEGQEGVRILTDGVESPGEFLIEADGKMLRFQQEWSLPPADLDTILTQKEKTVSGKELTVPASSAVSVLDSKALSENVDADLLQAIRTELCTDPMMKKAAVSGLFRLKATGDGFSDLKHLFDLLGLSPYGQIGRLLRKVEGIRSEAAKKTALEAAGSLFADIRKEMILAEVGTQTARISEGTELRKNKVITSRLAALLGIQRLIPKSELAGLSRVGETLMGVVTEEAPEEEVRFLRTGQAKELFSGKSLQYAFGAVRDLLDLQVFDALCAQTDRHEANRVLGIARTSLQGKTVYTAEEAKGVGGELSFGRINYGDFAEKNYSGIKQMEDENGILIPGMSRSLAKALLSLTPKALEEALQDLLRGKAMSYLSDRLTGIREAIRIRMDYEAKHPGVPTKFLSDREWPDFHSRLQKLAAEKSEIRSHLAQYTYLDPQLLTGKS